MEMDGMEPEYDVLAKNDAGTNHPGILDNWMLGSQFFAVDEDSVHNVFALKTDPLLSQAQLDENSALGLDSLETITIPRVIPKKSKLEVKKPNILRSFNKIKKKNHININLHVNELSKRYKGDVLKQKRAVALEMIFIRNGIGLFIKDESLNQLFLTQHIKMTTMPTQQPVRHQFVKTVNLLPLCEKTNIELPQIITNISSKIHLCPLRDCTEAFLQPASAKSHALKHLGLKPYNCTFPGCAWEFPTQNKLHRHLATHEPVKKSYICDYEGCDRDFTTIYNLNEHKKKHFMPASKNCPVLDCSMVFQTETELNSHCKESHTRSEAPFTCNNCDRGFFKQSMLTAHAKSHLSENNECPFGCGKVFHSSYRLKEHMRSHTGSRPYECTFEGCSWCFTTASKLKRHQKIHTKERKFSCTVTGCNKAFSRSEHLRDHLRAHADAKMPKTHDCNSCGTSLPSKTDHFKKHHSDMLTEENLASNFDNEIKEANNSQPILIQTETNVTSFCEKTEDELLEEAIKSLEVPELILEEELIPQPLELLDNAGFSTVNLKDLD